MSDMFGIGSALGAIGNTIIGGLNYGLQKEYAEKNYNLQREQYEYQKQLQQEIFNREDNATQRKVTDLIKAGLNPLLASGGGANAGNAVGMVQMGGQEAPQLNMDIQGAVDSVYNSMKMQQDIATSKTQRALIDAEIASEVAKASNIAQDTQNKQQEYAERVYNYRKYKGLNLPIGFQANSPYAAAQGALFMANNAVDAVNKANEQAEKAEKEAHETWSRDKEKNHTSRYVNDPNMPSWLFEEGTK